MSNFIPNDYMKIQPKDPPWITSEIKRLIKKPNRFYKNYKHNGCKPEDQAKQNNLSNLENQLNDSATGPKAYWKVLNKLLNKSNIPINPPILYNKNLPPVLLRNQTCFTNIL